jgi:hypothetical protein
MQHNGQQTNDKKTSNALPNTTKNTKHLAARTDAGEFRSLKGLHYLYYKCFIRVNKTYSHLVKVNSLTNFIDFTIQR